MTVTMVVSASGDSVYAGPFTDERGNPCPCPTTDDIRHVCGSDGVTYINESTLGCENRCKNLREFFVRLSYEKWLPK